MKYRREPTRPPTRAAKAISYAQAVGFPSSLKRRAASAPIAMNASAKASPKVFSVIGPRSRSGCTSWRLALVRRHGLAGIDEGAEPYDLPRAHGRTGGAVAPKRGS